jgi:hypothetical protein
MHKYTRLEKSVMIYFPGVFTKIQADSFTLGVISAHNKLMCIEIYQ